jgi:hypothetical protein
MGCGGSLLPESVTIVADKGWFKLGESLCADERRRFDEKGRIEAIRRMQGD